MDTGQGARDPRTHKAKAPVQRCGRWIAETALVTAAAWTPRHWRGSAERDRTLKPLKTIASGDRQEQLRGCSNPRGPPPLLSADAGSVIKIGALHISQLRVPFDGARRGSVQVGGRVAQPYGVVRTRDRVAGAGYACSAHTVCRSFPKISSALSAKACGRRDQQKIRVSLGGRFLIVENRCTA
jgi:hypothetical protein